MAKLIDLGQILTLVPFSKSTIRRKLKSGEFPPPILLWGKHVWDERTVQDWMANQLSLRDQGFCADGSPKLP
jgi:predicted DNA-binding transcriptional regulator AlpA